MTLLETFFNGQVMLSAFPALMRGLFNTILLGLLACGIGIPVGLVISLVRLYAPKPFRWLAIGYIDIFRAMPVLVVSGADDRDNGSAEALARALPDARYEAVPGNHMSAVMKADLGEAIVRFLA